MEICMDCGASQAIAKSAAPIDGDHQTSRSTGRIRQPAEPQGSTRAADAVAWASAGTRPGLGMEQLRPRRASSTLGYLCITTSLGGEGWGGGKPARTATR